MRIFLSFFVFALLVVGCKSHKDVEESPQEKFEAFWNKTETTFKNPEESPLPEEEIPEFEGIPRYEYDSNYRVEAAWKLTPNEKPFKIEETGPLKRQYLKIAEMHFKLRGDSLKLAAYQSLDLIQNPEYKDYIFVPYTDLTNGFDTYGGGRYLDLTKPEGETIWIDFNQTYNPYCAYNDGFSCPIPPRENHLDTEVKAGAKYESKYDK